VDHLLVRLSLILFKRLGIYGPGLPQEKAGYKDRSHKTAVWVPKLKKPVGNQNLKFHVTEGIMGKSETCFAWILSVLSTALPS
jgi:hypothetical protein